MSKVIRFGVSLDSSLLGQFDVLIKNKKYPNRSEAIRDLIRKALVKEDWFTNKVQAATITLVYDHHKKDLLNGLTDIQHDFHNLIISSQHVHLDHDNCLEIIIVKGKPNDIVSLADSLKALKGVKHGQLTIATIGKDLK